MAFTRKYRNLSDAVTALDLNYKSSNLEMPIQVTAPQAWLDEFMFDLQEMPYATSEEARREILIYPILRLAWKPYSQYFTIWNHRQISASEELSGIPDYVIAKNSKRGRIIFEKPFVAVIEAKTDDFNEGWAQCVLEMLAIQELIKDSDFPVFGIVTTGEFWQFGKLEGNVMTQFKGNFSINDVDEVISALATVFEFYKNIFEKSTPSV
jgi:hypothetical protein